jgi:hypothetical protein
MLGFVVALAGCASAPPAGSPAPTPTSAGRGTAKKPYDFRSEGTIPPLTPADAANEPDVEERGVADSTIDVTDAEAPPDTAREPAPVPAAVATESLIDGFRVQMFATADREIAENASRSAQERVNLPAYVDLDGGMYKVRVGTSPPSPGRSGPGVIRASIPTPVASKVRARRAVAHKAGPAMQLTTSRAPL